MFKKILFISLLFVLSIGMVSANENITFDDSVADGDILASDDGDFLGAVSEGSFKELQNKIDNAADGSVIVLDKNYSFADDDEEAILIESKSLTIDGNGMVLDGKKKSKILWIDNIEGSVVLKNLIFKNGNSSDGGAIAISNSDGEVSIYGSSFIDNHADDSGGAISTYFATTALKVYNSSFINNHASDGGAIYNSEKPLTVSGSKFISNVAENHGGAIYSGYTTNIVDSVFTGNAADYGGAIYQDLKKLTVQGSKFNNNSATCGGAIENGEYGNGKLDIDSSLFTNNTAGETGGAINNLRGKLSNSIFESNKAGEMGGAIHSFEDSDSLKCINNTFRDNNNPEYDIVYKKFATYYNSGKVFKVSLMDKYSKQPVTGQKIELTLVHEYVGKNSGAKTLSAVTDSNGVASFNTISKLRANYYTAGYDFRLVPDTGGITYGGQEIAIKKAPTIAKASSVSAKYKKSKYLKISVKDKHHNTALKNIKVKVKVFTGKKSKTYTVKTNKKGVAKFNTKSISRGAHNVVISSGNSNYKISAKSTITIK